MAKEQKKETPKPQHKSSGGVSTPSIPNNTPRTALRPKQAPVQVGPLLVPAYKATRALRRYNAGITGMSRAERQKRYEQAEKDKAASLAFKAAQEAPASV